jgi:CRISPR system Cascade subunit CasC
MFGRMFANAADRQTEAAVAVSPAVTTHRAVIETDYFTTVDDLGVIYGDGDRGASYLDTAMFTTGVYYRTVTFDRDQLARSWSLLGAAGSDDRLRAMVRSVLYALPSGKKNATAAQTRPLVVLAEEQSCRCAYSFDTPVQPADGGGYVGGSLVALADKRQRALAFDPTAFGVAKVAGTAEGLDAFGAEVVDGPQLVDFVSDWLLERA